MLPVKVIITNLGKVEREYQSLIKFYENRISRLSRFSTKYSKKLDKEAILLDPDGDMVSTDYFYSLIKGSAGCGKSVHFVVGPPEGFGKEKEEHRRISLSSLTLRHELAYLVLLEQVYRALLKMKGTDYSK